MDYIFVWDLGERCKYRLRIPEVDVESITRNHDHRTSTVVLFRGDRILEWVNSYERVSSVEGTIPSLSSARLYDRYIHSGQQICLDLSEDIKAIVMEQTYRPGSDSSMRIVAIKAGICSYLSGRGIFVVERNVVVDWSDQFRTARVDFSRLGQETRIRLRNHGIKSRFDVNW